MIKAIKNTDAVFEYSFVFLLGCSFCASSSGHYPELVFVGEGLVVWGIGLQTIEILEIIQEKD